MVFRTYKNILDDHEISEDDVSNFMNNNVGFYRLDMQRLSRLLLVQLTRIYKDQYLSHFSVTDVIQNLENIRPSTLVRDARMFRFPPLNRFYKIHFTDPRFMPKNLENELGAELFDPETGELNIKNEKVRRVVEEAERRQRETPIPNGVAGWISEIVVVEGYKKRSLKKRMTGEWIIFGKHDGKNHYLCIANHTEGDGDTDIYNYIESCCKEEFPFLF